MDLLALFSSLRRHKVIAAVVLLLTVGGNVFILFGIPPQYESKAQFVLISPPQPPTDAQIQRDPGLGRLNINNPYLRLPNSVVVDVLTQRVAGETVRQKLVSRGADYSYDITSTKAIGSGLVIEITGTGHSAREARRTLDLVAESMKGELETMQMVDGADKRFLFQALPINPASDPTRIVTGTMRSIIAVSAAGMVLLFALISIAEAARSRRTKGKSHVDRFDSELTVILPRTVIPGQRQVAKPFRE
jgi:capsular polysaccharide biosynthesis protein